MNTALKYFTFFTLMFFLSLQCIKAGNETKEFDVNGLKVILKPSNKDVISVKLFVEGGSANYEEDKQGIENITLKLMIDGGTKNLSKIEFNTAADEIGTSFGAGTSLDYGTISMTCVKMFWNKSWDLFADAILNPAFSDNEFNILNQQLIASAKSTLANPDAYLAMLSRKNTFPNSNYKKIPEGTPESLASIKVGDVKNYYNSIITKKRCFLVVVGNVTEDELTKLITNSLAKLPAGSVAPEEQRTILTEGKIFVEDRTIATNYLRGILSAPYANTQDGVAMRIAISIVRDRFFKELRTKRSLSYAPSASYATSAINNPYSVVYISTTDPVQSIQVMVDEINKIKKEGFTEEELKSTKEVFLTRYYMQLETASSLADALGLAELQGDWKLMDKINEDVKNTTLKSINKVFDEYSKAIVWTYLGKKDAVKDEDFKQPVETSSKPY